ncbi:MAG: UDP-3-O-(3-hydroxymyristoyl)glucosamine N-acyltransferase [Planctomycetia bacterium]|nr:UDP-3-O-(3-hydroxymyristoyl)glucosamine N-acyltransferase [Planctomycetia bacterium]
MHVSLAELAKRVGGKLGGDGAKIIAGAAPLRDAGPADITFVDCLDHANLLQTTRAGAAVVPPGLATSQLPVIEARDVHAAFTAIVSLFRPPRRARRIGVSPQAVVSPTAVIGADVDIHPLAVVGDAVEIGDGSTIHSGAKIMAGCKIGPHTTIFPNAVLYDETIVGARCIIHGGAVIGSYGFGYRFADGRHELAAQLGNVVIEDDVEIGAGTTIDRGTYGPTLIGQGTKIDNLVQIAHNCRIGRHNLLCSQVGIAGSCTTGDFVVMGGKAGVRDHVQIGDRAALAAMAGVTNHVPAGETWGGAPAMPMHESKRAMIAMARLPELRDTVRRLEREVAELQRQAGKGQSEAA